MGYAIRITTRAVEVVSGADQAPGIVAAEASGAKAGLRAKWGGSNLRPRPRSARMVPQGNGWVLEGSANDSPYTGTPALSNGFLTPGSVVTSPYVASASSQSPATPGYGAGLTPSTPARSASGLTPHWTPQSAAMASGSPGSHVAFPRSPSPSGNGVSMEPLPPRRGVRLSNASDAGNAENGLTKDEYD
jgi:endoplasmic reticulum-Golgi intermediate compartment protein 2